MHEHGGGMNTSALKGPVGQPDDRIKDIDWYAPLDPEKFFLPPKIVSLYGTPLWWQMTREQQIELSRQELANALSMAIWFENILSRALLRDVMHTDPSTAAIRYALTEAGDEMRHMVMFGKTIERIGAKPVRPRLYQRIISSIVSPLLRGPLLWVTALTGEEIFDAVQRQMMDDPELQPMIRQVMRIHVTEEARHIQCARESLRRQTREMRPITRSLLANINGLGGLIFGHLSVSPIPYRRSGLDAQQACTAARKNLHRHEVQVNGFAPLAAFLAEVGLMGPVAHRLWKHSKFL